MSKMSEELKRKIINGVDVESYYRQNVKMFDGAGSSNELVGFCPFHEDTKPSFGVHIGGDRSGVWICRSGCPGSGSRNGGDIFQFHMLLTGADFPETQAYFAKLAGVDISEYSTYVPKNKKSTIPFDVSLNYHKFLLETETLLNNFIERRGISLESIKKYQIGYDGSTNRYTIPVYDEEEDLVNIRKYSLRSNPGFKMINYTEYLRDKEGNITKDKNGKNIKLAEWGAARIFDIKNLIKNETIILCEGETDCIIANQHGFPAITFTCGAGTYKKEWNDLFKDKILYIVYDMDDAGEKGALKVSSFLKGIAKEIYIVKLPEEVGETGDITDFFVKLKYTDEQFRECLYNTVPTTSVKEDDLVSEENKDDKKEIVEMETISAKLFETTGAEHTGKRIKTRVLVSGKNEPAYIIPGIIRFECANAGCGIKKCLGCIIEENGGVYELKLTPESPEILEFINVTKNQQEFVMTKLAKGSCSKCKTTTPNDKRINIEEISVVPQIDANPDVSARNAEYVEKTLYYAGKGIETNKNYLVEGFVFPEPKRQLATVILDNVSNSNDSIESFKMTPKLKEELKIFQPAEGQTIKDKLKEKYKDLERNKTYIFNRQDMMFAFDLVFHSVLKIKQQNMDIKGWVNGFILGDTATGKTQFTTRIMQHYNLGERAGGSDVTRAGLIGAVVQQSSGRWVLRWGRLALNDKRLLVIEEVSDMDEEIFEKLTDVMSSGIITMNKANGHEQTFARTRLLFISNPKRGVMLEAYSSGPAAVREIIKKDEDIRRMDFIITVAKNEVSSDIINSSIDNFGEVPHVYTTYLCHNIVSWCWSRLPDQIIFTPEADEEIYASTKRLIDRFDDSFPLIEDGDTKNKMRRLSASLAGMLFSCDESGEQIIVEKKHVQEIEKWLNKEYEKDSMRYVMFSEQAKMTRSLKPAKKSQLIAGFKDLTDWRDLVKVLWSSHIFQKSDIADKMGYSRDEVGQVFKFLSRNFLIKKIGSYGYKRENNLVTLLKEMLQDEKLGIDFNEVYMPEPLESYGSKPQSKKDTNVRVGTEKSGEIDDIESREFNVNRNAVIAEEDMFHD